MKSIPLYLIAALAVFSSWHIAAEDVQPPAEPTPPAEEIVVPTEEVVEEDKSKFFLIISDSWTSIRDYVASVSNEIELKYQEIRAEKESAETPVEDIPASTE